MGPKMIFNPFSELVDARNTFEVIREESETWIRVSKGSREVILSSLYLSIMTN